jgi:hypothetical protein
MKTLIIIGGFYNLAFAIFHVLFWKMFRWKRELSSLSIINRSVMQILNSRLIFVFFVFAYVSFFYADELLATSIGKGLLFAIALFWFGRAIEQIIFFGLRRGLSIAFFVVFLIGAAIYFYPFMRTT